MEQQANYIRRIEIHGLWGRFNISWDLRPDVNILSGINGVGKTTILNRSVGYLEDLSGEMKSDEKNGVRLFFDNPEATYIPYDVIRSYDRPLIMAAIYLKEPITNKKVLGIFVGAMGALILILSSQAASGGNRNLIGDLLCLVAQISFSIYLTVFKGLSQQYSAVTINKWMFVYASICYIPFSYYDISTIQWASISTVAIIQVLYVVLGGSFLAYLCIMTAQKLLRPTVVSMYNYMQPIVATIAAIIMGIGSFGWQKGLAIALVFLGVYIVTQSKSKADFEKAGREL